MEIKLMSDNLELQEKYEYIVTHITHSLSNKQTPYDLGINDDEKRFIAATVLACDEIKMCRHLRFERLSDKTLNAWCDGYVGKINLRSSRTFMQIILANDNVVTLENKTLDQYIKAIPRWIRLIQHYKKK